MGVRVDRVVRPARSIFKRRVAQKVSASFHLALRMDREILLGLATTPQLGLAASSPIVPFAKYCDIRNPFGNAVVPASHNMQYRTGELGCPEKQ